LITILACVLSPSPAGADGIELATGNYFMEMASGNILNLDTGEYYLFMGSGQAAAPADPVPPEDFVAAEATPAPVQEKPQQMISTGDYFIQLHADGGTILNLNTGDCYMKME